MFKKTLVAVAALGAFGSAFAANVTLYGVADLGLGYAHTNNNGRTDTWQMQSGANSGSRFGLKGTEELGNGVSVGFVLENGFDADTGKLGNGDRLFGRESQVYLTSDFGTLSFGRVGELASGNGTFGMFGSNVSPFSTSWTNVYGHKAVIGGDYDRLDNTVTYRTPALAGLTATVQYSMNGDANKGGVENTKSANRQAAAGLNYKLAGLDMNLIYTYKDKAYTKDEDGVITGEPDEGQAVHFGATYDCGVAKTFLAAGYWEHMTLSAADTAKLSDTKGWGVNLGVQVPVDAFKLKLNAGYADAENQAADNADITRWTVGAGTEYTLSKRTFVYAGAGLTNTKYDGTKTHAYGASAGMVHKF